MATVTVAQRVRSFWNHPAGPKTIHFWAPTFKWGISLANVADFQRPPELISYPQQVAITATGLIWSRFSTQIVPVSTAAGAGGAARAPPTGHRPSWRQSSDAALQPTHFPSTLTGQLQPAFCQRIHGGHWAVPAVSQDPTRHAAGAGGAAGGGRGGRRQLLGCLTAPGSFLFYSRRTISVFFLHP